MLDGFFKNMGQNIENKAQQVGQNIQQTAFGGAFDPNLAQKANPFGQMNETMLDNQGNPVYLDKEGNEMSGDDVDLYKKQGWSMNDEGQWELSDQGKKKLQSKTFFKGLGSSLLSAASKNSKYTEPWKKQTMGGLNY